MDALLAAIRRSPPTRAGFHKLLQAIQSNLALEGSELLGESELLDKLEQMFDAIPDFKSQMELHRELDRHSRTSDALLARVQNIVQRDEEARQRQQQEDAFAKQLGTSPHQRGNVGQDEQPGSEPSGSVSSATVTRCADGKERPGDAADRERLAHKDRQISALAAQLKQHGLKPDFAG